MGNEETTVDYEEVKETLDAALAAELRPPRSVLILIAGADGNFHAHVFGDPETALNAMEGLLEAVEDEDIINIESLEE